MATLNVLKNALRKITKGLPEDAAKSLTDEESRDGFRTFTRDLGRKTYDDFIIPQLTQVLLPLIKHEHNLSIFEIGPGPRTVLGDLSDDIRRSIKTYHAYEPNLIFAKDLHKQLKAIDEAGPSVLPNVPGDQIEIRMRPYESQSEARGADNVDHDVGEYDVILFCHSMYGFKAHKDLVIRAQRLLSDTYGGGRMVVFHRQGALDLGDLISSKTVSQPAAKVRVKDDDEHLDSFASYIAGHVPQDTSIRARWRKVCRELGQKIAGVSESAESDSIPFSTTDVMVVFSQNASALSNASRPSCVRSVESAPIIKNRQARRQRAAAVLAPTNVREVVECVKWTLTNDLQFTVLGGTHSDRCVLTNVVSLDLKSMNKIHFVAADRSGSTSSGQDHSLLVVESGCTIGDIVREASKHDVAVPLGARPSVGVVSWLQGGFGHLSRRDGQSCDSIVGAIVVSVINGKVLCVGSVPRKHRPADSVTPDDEEEYLWAIRGAGTNIGVVTSVVFNVTTDPTYALTSWTLPIYVGGLHGRFKEINTAVSSLSQSSSVDAYIYYERNELRLGIDLIEVLTKYGKMPPTPPFALSQRGCPIRTATAASHEMFDQEMYMSRMHGGHGGGKTSTFKRCMFLKTLDDNDVVGCLKDAFKASTDLCYVHLVHGIGLRDAEAGTSACGCRKWEYASVVTGAWPRELEEHHVEQQATNWIYDLAYKLLPNSEGAYCADLGRDPRDTPLAAVAFGPNRYRLAQLKSKMDPNNVLAYACPLPDVSRAPELIVLVTGKYGVGKDHCAKIWAETCKPADSLNDNDTKAKVVSISDAVKSQYATITNIDLQKLLKDRAFKEEHRAALTKFF